MTNVNRSLAQLAATLLIAALIAVQPTRADEVRIKVPVPPVPKIVLPVPPPMIWLPGISVYVAHDSPYPIFAHKNRYYLHHENIWYIGPAYNGPWTVIEPRRVPRSLRGFHQERWRDYEAEADRRFREDREERHYPYYADRPGERAHWQQHHERGNEHRYNDADQRGERRRGRDERD